MYNILEVEDKIKGLPDQALMREAQFPSGDVPQFLVVSELQRRNEMRKSYAAMQEPSQTVPVAQQVVAEAGQGIAGVVGGSALPASAPMQAQTPMAAPIQSSMPAPMQPPMPSPQAPSGIVGMQSGRTVPYRTQYTDFTSMSEASDLEDLYRSLNPDQAQEFIDLINRGVKPDEAVRTVSSVFRDRDGVTEYVGIAEGGFGMPDDVSKLSPLDQALARYGSDYSILSDEAYQSGRNRQGQITSSILDLIEKRPTTEISDREFIPSTIDRQKYIDQLSAISEEDVASRQTLIDEMQEKSKKDALSAFLMSLGAGIAGGDISRGIEEGSKAAQGMKQLADQRIFSEQKAMRDVQSAAQREAVQLGLSAEEADLAGERAQQEFEMKIEDRKNTAAMNDYSNSLTTLMSQSELARADTESLLNAIKTEDQIILEAASIRQRYEEEKGVERRDVRSYIESFVDVYNDRLDSSIATMNLDATSIRNLLDAYRRILEEEFGLAPAGSVPPPPIDELVDLSGFSVKR
jgi:hypothetical protein